MTFLWKALGFPTSIPNFPYSPITEENDKLCYSTSHIFGVEWNVQRGRATEENNAEVLIFSISLKGKSQTSCTSSQSQSSSSSVMTQIHSCIPALTQNCLQRAKSLKLPGLLKCYGGTVYNNTVYIATEYATPLYMYLNHNNNNNNHTTELYSHTDTGVDVDVNTNTNKLTNSNANYENSVALGLKNVATAIAALHKNNLIHRHVNMHTVYVTPGGLWKLFGFELLMPMESSSNEFVVQQSIQLYLTAVRDYVKSIEVNNRNCITTYRDESIISMRQWPPELLSNCNHNNNNIILNSSNGNTNGDVSEDAWGVGCLIYDAFAFVSTSLYPSRATLDTPSHNVTECYNKTNSGRKLNGFAEEHDNIRGFVRYLPVSLQNPYTHLLHAESSKRLRVVQFIDHCEFINTNDYVNIMTSLELLPVMSKTNREHFCEEVQRRVASFPLEACLHCILPSLINSIQFGAVANIVEPVMAIISRLSSSGFSNHSIRVNTSSSNNDSNNIKDSIVQTAFAKFAEPAIVTLFACDDALLRLRLLQHSKCYASQLSLTTLQTKIWPSYMKGFTHSQAMVQEATARALIHFAPVLHANTTLLVKDAVPALAILQQHIDGAIRTNATICLCKIAQYLPESNKSNLLLSGLIRMLKDPFVPSRLAAIRGLYTLISIFTFTQCAMQILPAVAAFSLDKEREVREYALKLLKEITRILEHASEEQSKREQLHSNEVAQSNNNSNININKHQIEEQPYQKKQQEEVMPQTLSPLTVHYLNNFTSNNYINTTNTTTLNTTIENNQQQQLEEQQQEQSSEESYQHQRNVTDTSSAYSLKTVNSTYSIPTPSAASSGFYSPHLQPMTQASFQHSKPINQWPNTFSSSNENVIKNKTYVSGHDDHADTNSENDGWSDDEDDNNNNNVNNNNNKLVKEEQKTSIFSNSNTRIPHSVNSVKERNINNNNNNNNNSCNNTKSCLAAENVNYSINGKEDPSTASSSQFVSTSPSTTSQTSATFPTTLLSNVISCKTNQNNLDISSIKPNQSTKSAIASLNVSTKPRKKIGGLGAARLS